MAYIRKETQKCLRVDYRITPVAIEDAIHAYLDEDELARLIATLVRDPTIGRKTGEDYDHIAGDLRLRYRIHQASPDLMMVYVLRIYRRQQDARLSGLMAQGARAVGNLALDVVKSRIKALLKEDN
ncbi:hypothetical protein [Phaeobacter gallaeciensis]|uniref:Uncharacterized protein n=1 Tax=Phaeobacter gallaeciensis TaxID=60890 RepID=A0AAC9ZA88_9RHOB|nr:hypothetical protein [Phaeobacter gallaeciensis]AHD10135.1 hypothetical protein Gal_02390 [Phaeobacter gallaeciensis DSM 26640]ATE93399.1 hypothetical protein PhaeoP11_02381 [Phaeobacter gallaeciensis]ATE96780.1 hypothetical protein PhaeoP73_01466 [Phaeobacter gallaeciensis]ATF02063.1 hypothetical protein PhaeoP75_02430 [Phaeobacter gallaeciensis]ATF06443.1 hypothetical protein PhaeoP63_02379 [Phaeobacter gallaeciensis]